MCLVSQTKNKINGIGISLESIDNVPDTPESGAPEDEGNFIYKLDCRY